MDMDSAADNLEVNAASIFRSECTWRVAFCVYKFMLRKHWCSLRVNMDSWPRKLWKERNTCSPFKATEWVKEPRTLDVPKRSPILTPPALTLPNIICWRLGDLENGGEIRVVQGRFRRRREEWAWRREYLRRGDGLIGDFLLGGVNFLMQLLQPFLTLARDFCESIRTHCWYVSKVPLLAVLPVWALPTADSADWTLEQWP
jgi:hypothetical protein